MPKVHRPAHCGIPGFKVHRCGNSNCSILLENAKIFGLLNGIDCHVMAEVLEGKIIATFESAVMLPALDSPSSL